MKKTLIPFAALSIFAAVATSCGNNTTTWTYADGLADGELGYVTLYGEEGNVEANDRMTGVEAALQDIASKLYNPKTGKKGVTIKNYGKLLCVDNGAAWSGEAAKKQLQPVLTKHKGKIDLVSSNNDGMAVAVTALNNLPKNTPIVGFDALTDACEMIEKGSLAGSVTQNGDDQGLLALTILANVLGGKETLTTGYPKTNLELAKAENHIYQTKISAVTKANADKFKPGAYVDIKENADAKNKKILVATYSATDNFINETYKLALEHYGAKMGFEIKVVSGDGKDDVKLRQSIQAIASQYDAYAFNMIEHTAYKDYLKLAGEKPVVFFNRQPKDTTTSKTIDDLKSVKVDETLTKTNVYFVGTAAGGQGTAQGQVVKDFFNDLSAKAEADAAK